METKSRRKIPGMLDSYKNSWFAGLWQVDDLAEKTKWDLRKEWGDAYPGLSRGTSPDTFFYVLERCFGKQDLYNLRLKAERPPHYEIPNE